MALRAIPLELVVVALEQQLVVGSVELRVELEHAQRLLGQERRREVGTRHEEHRDVCLGHEGRARAQQTVQHRVAAVRVARHEGLQVHAARTLAAALDVLHLAQHDQPAVLHHKEAGGRVSLRQQYGAARELARLEQMVHLEQPLPGQLGEHRDRRYEDRLLRLLLELRSPERLTELSLREAEHARALGRAHRAVLEGLVQQRVLAKVVARHEKLDRRSAARAAAHAAARAAARAAASAGVTRAVVAGDEQLTKEEYAQAACGPEWR